MPRWLPGARRAALLVAVATALSAAGPAGAAKVITVKAPTVLQMAGSDIYCTVIQEGAAPAVACFHDPGGPSSNVRKGYAIAAFDEFVAVEPPGTTHPNKTVKQPRLAAYPASKGGSEHRTVLKLSSGDGAFVSGTHMAVVVAPAKGGGNAIGVIYLDGKGNPVVGSSTIGISNNSVTIVKVTGPKTSKVLYKHAVY
jgi:hypothetical protein